MDFFQAQDAARRKSKSLVAYFIAAVVAIIAVIYVVTIITLAQTRGEDDYRPIALWQPDTFAIVATITLTVILLGSFFKSLALRSGGGAVARSVGGVRIEPNTTNAAERRLLNVVEEMAIAAGIRVPEVYLLPESGINAFAAGLSVDDAAVAVTQGTLDTLTRDELQGVVAHEFSHILNGDMRLNVRLIGLLFGILLLAIIGRVILYSMRFSRGGRSSDRGGRNSGGVMLAILALGLTLLIVGYIGVLFGRLIQAAVSRQREFLADASAVQFTRNPSGIGGALKKIGGLAAGSRVQNAHATETGHMFFANALSSSFSTMFATHPPLVERIRAIEPDFDGKFPSVAISTTPPSASGPGASQSRQRQNTIRPEQFIASVAAAGVLAQPETGAALIASIPEPLRAAARDSTRARAIVLALLADTSDPGSGKRQAQVLTETMTPAEMQMGAAAVPLLNDLPTEARLALLDLALPALRELPTAFLTGLLAALDQMVLADYRITPFEFAIQHLVRRNLRAAGRISAEPGAPSGPLAAKSEDVAALLATIARAGTDDVRDAQDAFAAGARHFGLTDDRLGDRGDGASAIAGLALVVQRLERVPPMQKKKLLETLAVTASTDGTIKPDELALLRAFAAALDCPAPLS